MNDQTYDNRNKGVLFKNFGKTPESKQPDFTGTINVDGVEHELAGWTRTSVKGTEYLSLKLGRRS